MNPIHKLTTQTSIRLSILTAILSIFCAGCRKDIAWNESHPLPEEGWDSSTSIDFVIDPAAYDAPPANRFAEMTARAIGDTVCPLRGNFSAVVSLRYTDRCNASSIKLIAERSSLDSDSRIDTISITLFHPDGAPAGRGRFGIYEASTEIPGIFPASKGTTLTLTPIPYATPPSGLRRATLILHK